MEFDLEQFLTEDAPARVRTQLDETQLPTIGTADNIADAVLNDAPLPALYFIFSRGTARTFANGQRRMVVGRRAQMKKIKVTAAVVTESYASKEDGRLGAWRMLPLSQAALVGWKTATMKTTLEFVDERFVLRTPDTTRVVHEFDLEAYVDVFATPAAP